jgi:hypothetical protein
MNIIEWLQRNNPQLLEELMLLDRATDGALFGEPNHTLSYNIAMAAQKGNFVAKLLCHVLNILSPNHCVSAIADESTKQWRDAADVIG